MSGRFRFGEFVLDGDTRELWRGHQVVSLSPKAFQLLEILIENHPKAMTKGALQDLLWPNTFVVEKNLANLVAEIRQALGDSAEHPRFLRTVPRFGYAFLDAPTAQGRRAPRQQGRSRFLSAVSPGRMDASRCAKAITSSDAIPTPSSSSIRRACRAGTR